MRTLQNSLVALLSLTAFAAVAQPLAGPISADGTRPGHSVGVGASEPSSGTASNIRRADTRSMIAPTLPIPEIGAQATPRDYLQAARIALVAHRTGEAQQALEMAETRALDRVVAPGQTTGPSESGFVAHVRAARHALGDGDSAATLAAIDVALAG